MRDIIVLTAKSVPTEELVEFVRSYASRVDQPYEKRTGESGVGELPNALHVFDDTAPTNCYFSEQEKSAIELKLEAPVEGCVSIHFTSTDAAFALADGLARDVARRWHGKLDYSGTGGAFEVPPNRTNESITSGK